MHNFDAVMTGVGRISYLVGQSVWHDGPVSFTRQYFSSPPTLNTVAVFGGHFKQAGPHPLLISLTGSLKKFFIYRYVEMSSSVARQR